MKHKLTKDQRARLAALRLVEQRGHEYYMELGRKGGKATVERYPRSAFGEWGMMGGRPRRRVLGGVSGVGIQGHHTATAHAATSPQEHGEVAG
jgi:hypothetical protein